MFLASNLTDEGKKHLFSLGNSARWAKNIFLYMEIQRDRQKTFI